jgi:hypothetical protein
MIAREKMPEKMPTPRPSIDANRKGYGSELTLTIGVNLQLLTTGLASTKRMTRRKNI